MSDSGGGSDQSDGKSEHDTSRTDGTVESYTTDKRVVIYDSENPLAWIETTQSVRLAEFA